MLHLHADYATSQISYFKLRIPVADEQLLGTVASCLERQFFQLSIQIGAEVTGFENSRIKNQADRL